MATARHMGQHIYLIVGRSEEIYRAHEVLLAAGHEATKTDWNGPALLVTDTLENSPIEILRGEGILKE